MRHEEKRFVTYKWRTRNPVDQKLKHSTVESQNHSRWMALVFHSDRIHSRLQFDRYTPNACKFIVPVQRLMHTRLPSTVIIVSLEGSIIEKPSALSLSLSPSGRCIVVVNNIPGLRARARAPCEMVRRITGHYRDVSSRRASFTGPSWER